VPVFESIGAAGYYIKRRPTFRRGDLAGFGGHSGVVFAKKPKKYPLTSQQKKVQSVAKECGIHPGISRSELIQKMRECVGPKMRGA